MNCGGGDVIQRTVWTTMKAGRITTTKAHLFDSHLSALKRQERVKDSDLSCVFFVSNFNKKIRKCCMARFANPVYFQTINQIELFNTIIL
jgi:hypothetical protein